MHLKNGWVNAKKVPNNAVLSSDQLKIPAYLLGKNFCLSCAALCCRWSSQGIPVVVLPLSAVETNERNHLQRLRTVTMKLMSCGSSREAILS